jgi:hypothetical protein
LLHGNRGAAAREDDIEVTDIGVAKASSRIGVLFLLI